MVQVAPKRLEMMELDVPPIAAGEALLRVEACGLCGTDIEQYHGRHRAQQQPDSYPMIPGHESVGIVEEIGAEAARTWGVAAGERVALLSMLSCRRCEYCLRGDLHLCKGFLPPTLPHYGFMPLGYAHGLWGGYSEYIHLHPATLLCKVPANVPPQFATLYQALAAGLRWAVAVPGTEYCDSVLILGCGQRGLAALLALRAAGVRSVIVTGLAKDAFKLELARKFGAQTIVVDQESTVERVMALTGGRGVDVALDVTPRTPQPFLDAIEAVRVGGTIVAAGIKDNATPAAVIMNRLVYKELTIKGVNAQPIGFYQRAIDLLARELETFAPLHTHEMPLADVAEAIEMLSGERPGHAISISIHP